MANVIDLSRTKKRRIEERWREVRKERSQRRGTKAFRRRERYCAGLTTWSVLGPRPSLVEAIPRNIGMSHLRCAPIFARVSCIVSRGIFPRKSTVRLIMQTEITTKPSPPLDARSSSSLLHPSCQKNSSKRARERTTRRFLILCYFPIFPSSSLILSPVVANVFLFSLFRKILGNESFRIEHSRVPRKSQNSAVSRVSRSETFVLGLNWISSRCC